MNTLDNSFLLYRCFDRFFKAVNSKEGKLIPKRRAYLMDDLELIGLDYLWRVVLCAPDEIAAKAIELLKETYTNLGPRLQANQVSYLPSPPPLPPSQQNTQPSSPFVPLSFKHFVLVQRYVYFTHSL